MQLQLILHMSKSIDSAHVHTCKCKRMNTRIHLVWPLVISQGVFWPHPSSGRPSCSHHPEQGLYCSPPPQLHTYMYMYIKQITCTCTCMYVQSRVALRVVTHRLCIIFAERRQCCLGQGLIHACLGSATNYL